MTSSYWTNPVPFARIRIHRELGRQSAFRDELLTAFELIAAGKKSELAKRYPFIGKYLTGELDHARQLCAIR